MQAISLFSGVGGFELGFERAGIETILQAEQDEKCQHVLERHWPNVERVNDVRDITTGTADLIYGGFPCQDVSVAGRREGLRGERSSLWFEFARVLDAVRPRWCVVENVPGLLSSAGGRDFGIILRDLDELGYAIAWGTLDAQHFGVPQRRRRVFVIGGPRGPGPAAVLALAEGGSGDSPESGTAGQDVAHTLTASASQSSWKGADHEDYILAKPIASHHRRDDLDTSTYVIASAITASAGHHGHSSPRGDGADNLVYPALDARHGKGPNSSVAQAPPIPTSPVTAKWATGSGGPSGDEAQNLVVPDVRGVRRLMPIECERLMGWPDDWTRWDADGNEIADSHRYRMCGNGVVAPVAEWIGHRLVRVDSLLA